MARDPNRPPSGGTERRYLLIAVGIIVVATVIFVISRMFTPEPAPDPNHGGPNIERAAPPTEEPELPEEREPQ
jgi:hypothetical protein